MNNVAGCGKLRPVCSASWMGMGLQKKALRVLEFWGLDSKN